MNSHEQDKTGNFPSCQRANSYFGSEGLKSYKRGMDLVRKLILERLQELGLNMSEVSHRLGRNETYLQQFLKRGSPRELHERERALLADILKVPEDELRGPSTPLPKRSYEKVASRKSLVDHDTPAPYFPVEGHSAKIVPAADLFSARIDLPVFGTALSGGGDGAVVTKHAVDWTVRPPSLLRVADGYGLIVPDNTMAPEHRAGSIALVNPHLPPKFGESCVLRSVADDGEPLALVREYRGETDTHWKVAQHSPPKVFSLKKSAWTCQKTVGSYFA